jgi:branched-chain amino acid transport system permease protein
VRRAFVPGALVLGLLLFPYFSGARALSVATLILYLAYAGQAWNVMMGFAGQLSLGHALYLGVGAYSAGGLFFHYGIAPWLGLWLAIALCVLLGLGIGYLAFRYQISGVQFALITIAFAEFTRIGFDHSDWIGGPAGMFLPVTQRERWELAELRGPPEMYYYLALGLAGAGLAISFLLSRSRAGYYLGAIRENEAAAQALGIDTFRWKLLAVAISAAMTAPAGVFLAFYYNSLFPEQIFHISRSIELAVGPMVGGVGTLIGPLVGTLLLNLLSEAVTESLALVGWELPGVKQLFYGLVLLVVVLFVPQGIWPPLARRLGIEQRR